MGYVIHWKNMLLRLMMVVMTLICNGCIYIVAGGVGAMGGYAVSPDTIEAVIERDVDVVWEAVIEVISGMGLIDQRDDQNYMLLARANGGRVGIELVRDNKHQIKMRVKARKWHLPRIHQAERIFIDIMSFMD